MIMRFFALALSISLLPASLAPADISVEVLTVGFAGEDALVYRGGSYAPVAVRLTLTNEKERQVFVHIEQYDRDGDILYADRMVTLTPDLKGPARPHWLYFVPNPEGTSGARRFTIQILDENGDAIEVAYNGRITRKLSLPNAPAVLGEKSFLVLSITTGTAGKIRTLSDYQNPDDSEFAKPLRVAHISPDLVPDHWIGLEMVDAIVWDAADPTALSSYQQQAILDWVRHGGRLFLAAGDTSDKLEHSEFRDHLPVEITGVKAMSVLPEELANATWGRESSSEVEYPRAMQVAQCELREGATPLVQSAAATQTYLAHMPVERGSVTYLALTLRDLFAVEGQPRDFFRRALVLRRKSDLSEQQGVWGLPIQIDLFGRMNQFIGFEAKTTIYMLIAILFVVVYIAVATAGGWFVLQKRNMLKHSWLVFFVVAAAASLISMMAVQTIQGVGRELHQLTIIDSTVNTYAAAAHCYFGLKTSSYVQDVAVLLPQGPPEHDESGRSPHYLRPLSPRIGSLEPGNRFADTKRYQAQPAKAQLSDVPIRATLKQFEGFWLGSMDGQMSADIRFRKPKQAGEPPFADGSTITNNLGHDLVDCYLIEAHLDPAENTLRGGRSQSITLHPIGLIQDGEQLDLVQRLSGLSTSKKEYPQDHKLQQYQKAWVDGLNSPTGSLRFGSFIQDPFRNLTDERRAIMLLTLFNEYEPQMDASGAQYYYGRGQIEILQTHGRWLDRSAELTRDTMLLVGFAPDDPGPAVLYSRRGKRKWSYSLPERAMTVYRITIPVDRET